MTTTEPLPDQWNDLYWTFIQAAFERAYGKTWQSVVNDALVELKTAISQRSGGAVAGAASGSPTSAGLPRPLSNRSFLEVGPWRAAVVLTSYWLHVPERIMLTERYGHGTDRLDREGRSPKEAESIDENKIAIRAVLSSIASPGRKAYEQVTVMDLELAKNLRRFKKVQDDIRELGRDWPVRVDDRGRRELSPPPEFIEMASICAFKYEKFVTEGFASRYLDGKLPAANGALVDRANAVVEAFFEHRYRALDAPSPVNMVLRWPTFAVQAKPEYSGAGEDYEGTCLVVLSGLLRSFKKALREVGFSTSVVDSAIDHVATKLSHVRMTPPRSTGAQQATTLTGRDVWLLISSLHTEIGPIPDIAALREILAADPSNVALTQLDREVDAVVAELLAPTADDSQPIAGLTGKEPSECSIIVALAANKLARAAARGLATRTGGDDLDP